MTRKRMYTIIALVVAMLLVSVGIGFTIARYISQEEHEQMLDTPRFYFSSDYLQEGGIERRFSASVNTVTFNLYNYENSLLVSELDVNYTVTVTCNEELVYTTSGQLTSSDPTHEITVTNLEPGKTYEVSAVGSNGFSKTLSATIIIGDESGFYKTIDSSNANYVTIRVWTGKSSGTVVITPPTGLIPDNTCPGMETTLIDATTTVILNEYSSWTFRYFKTTEYSSESEFSATLNGVEAIEVKKN